MSGEGPKKRRLFTPEKEAELEAQPAAPIPKFEFRGVGRPAKTLEDLPQGWQETILQEMAQGASKQEIKALLGVSNDQHARWTKTPEEGQADDYQEYREAIKRGEQLCEAWWEKTGRTNLQTPYFSATLWYMNMKNRFGWKDKSEVVNSDPGRDELAKQAINLGNGVKVVF
jgi:hypothetical protein